MIPWQIYEINQKANDQEANERFNILYEAVTRAASEITPDAEIKIAKSHGKIKYKDLNPFMKFSLHFVINGAYRFKNT